MCAHNPSKRAKNPRNDESLERKIRQKDFQEQDILERKEEEIVHNVSGVGENTHSV